MLAAVTTGVTNVINWFGSVISAIGGAEGSWADLLPFLGIAVGIFVVFAGVRLIKSVVSTGY